MMLARLSQLRVWHALRRRKARPYLIGSLSGVAIALAVFLVVLCLPAAIHAARLPARDLTDGARAVHVNGFDLWYREVGPKKPGVAAGRPVIVVIHGGPGMSDHYFDGIFDFLADGYRVVYYDQRGSGFSQIRPNPRYYRFSYLADDLEALRRRVIHADRLVLVAHSFGGPVAMSYAQKYPTHVAGFVFISSMPAKDYTPKPSGGPELDDWFSSQPPSVADAELLRSYLNTIGDSLYDPSSGIRPEIGYLSYLPGRLLWHSAIGYDYTASLSHLRVPGLITYGVRDTLLPSVPAAIHALLARSVLVRFNASGHWAFLEEPARFKSVVGQFIRSSFP